MLFVGDDWAEAHHATSADRGGGDWRRAEAGGARVLAEFGDDPDRYTDARARKNYSVRSTFVGLSGLEPLTSALSGPAAPAWIGGSTGLGWQAGRQEQLWSKKKPCPGSGPASAPRRLASGVRHSRLPPR